MCDVDKISCKNYSLGKDLQITIWTFFITDEYSLFLFKKNTIENEKLYFLAKLCDVQLFVYVR